jgi:hypothetical protein
MTKQKRMCPRWELQSLADAEVSRLAPGASIVAVVHHRDDEIVWDAECEGVGRVPWSVGYFVLPDDHATRALIPMLNAAMTRWQNLFDLGVTCEGRHA